MDPNFLNIMQMALSVCMTIVGAGTAFLGLRVHNAMLQMRLDQQAALAAHEEKLKTWINGSFMRSATVKEQLSTFDEKLNAAMLVNKLDQARAAIDEEKDYAALASTLQSLEARVANLERKRRTPVFLEGHVDNG